MVTVACKNIGRAYTCSMATGVKTMAFFRPCRVTCPRLHPLIIFPLFLYPPASVTPVSTLPLLSPFICNPRFLPSPPLTLVLPTFYSPSFLHPPIHPLPALCLFTDIFSLLLSLTLPFRVILFSINPPSRVYLLLLPSNSSFTIFPFPSYFSCPFNSSSFQSPAPTSASLPLPFRLTSLPSYILSLPQIPTPPLIPLHLPASLPSHSYFPLTYSRLYAFSQFSSPST